MKSFNDSAPPEPHSFKDKVKDFNYEIPVQQSKSLKSLRIFLLSPDIEVSRYYKLMSAELEFKVELDYFSKFDEARRAVKTKRYDVYLLDFELGAEKTGLDFYKEHLHYLSHEVVIQSNQDLASIINNYCRFQLMPVPLVNFKSIIDDIYSKRLQLMVVDDCKFTLLAWEMFHGKHNVRVIKSPEDALQIIEAQGLGISLCVLDYYYDNSLINGDELIDKMRMLRPEIHYVIASSSQHLNSKANFISKHDFEVRLLKP